MKPFTTPHRELRKQSFDRLTRYWNDPAYASPKTADILF